MVAVRMRPSFCDRYFRLASERRFSKFKARASDSMGTRASVWLFGAGLTVCVMIFSSRQIGLSADTEAPGVNPENQPPQSQETNLPASSVSSEVIQQVVQQLRREMELFAKQPAEPESITNSVADRKSTRLNSSHITNSY